MIKTLAVSLLPYTWSVSVISAFNSVRISPSCEGVFTTASVSGTVLLVDEVTKIEMAIRTPAAKMAPGVDSFPDCDFFKVFMVV